MKKILTIMQIAVALAFFQGAPAFANWGNDPGCGLGKEIFDGNPGQKHILQQVVGATLNATGMQTFGISTGTSGCTNDGVIVQNEKVNVFASVNLENLSQEMAQGHGEHLASLATLLGVPAKQQPAFFAMTQANYTNLNRSGETTAAAMLVALNQTMAVHPTLAKLIASH